VAVLADDDVVVHLDAERLGHLDDGLGHLDVGMGGRGVAARVIVDKYYINTYGIDIKVLLYFFSKHWGMHLGSAVHNTKLYSLSATIQHDRYRIRMLA